MTSMFLPSTTGRKLGYARVSTADQRLRMQRDALEAAGCERIYSDHGVSGAKDSRPGLNDLLDAARSGDTIVVFKLDRLGRSVLHLADLMVRFHADEIYFCSLSEGINTATPGGKLVYHLFSAFAEFQRDVIIENTREGLLAARRRGKSLGRPPILDAEQASVALYLIEKLHMPKAEVAGRFNVSPITLDRTFRRLELST